MSTATAIEQMLRNVSESEDWRGLAEAANTADTDRVGEYRVRANMAMGLAYQYAAIAQAEAAERQAAALEGIYAMLRYIAPAIEYQAAGDVSPEFKAGAAVEAMHADNVDSDPYGDGYNGPRADLLSARDDDQRAEDEQGYNAGIAPGLHR